MTSAIPLVTVVVPDYDDAIRHYVDDLGLHLVTDTPLGPDGKRWVVVGPDGGGASLVLARADGPAQVARIGDQTGGRVAFFLHTDDFGRAHARMAAAGIRFLEAPRHEPYGTVAQFVDRFGNRWDLLEPSSSAS